MDTRFKLSSCLSLVANLATFASVALSVILSCGCTNLFGQSPDAPKPLEIQMDGKIKDLPTDLKSWLKGGSGDIAKVVDTAVSAIDQFSNRVKGQTNSVYTKNELATFVTEVLSQTGSSHAGDAEAQVAEILRVKQILIGGANDLVTKNELARLKSLLLRAKPFLVELTPNIKILLFQNESATPDQVASARTALTAILNLIATEFERGDTGRPEASFKELLQSANKLGLENPAVSDWVPLAESVKVLILGGEPGKIHGSEWAPMIRTVAQVWGLGLSAKYNLSKNPEILGRDFPVLEEMTRDILDLLDKAVAAHDGSISNETFEKLIAVLDKNNMLPVVNGEKVTASTLNDLLPILFGKLLYGRAYSNYDRHGLHFGTEQIAKLRLLVNDWAAGQTLINKTMGSNASMPIAKFGSALTTRPLNRAEFSDAGTFAQAARAQKQLLLFMARGRPPVRDADGRLIVVTKKELPDLKKSDLNMLNVTRVIIGAVLTGWTHDKTAADGLVGLTEPEVQEAYIDLRDLGHDLNFIDIRSNQAGIRTYMETAIFMSSSDGDNRMGLQEGTEWLNFVMSGGAIADHLYEQMEQHQSRVDGKLCAAEKIDVLGHPKLRPDCFREAFLKDWASAMPNLPKLVSWAKADGSGERAKAMLNALEEAGRNRGASQDLVDSSEFRTLIPIAHYLESLFARHDVDQNGVLDNGEIWKAFPLLAPFIKKMGNGKADSEKVQKAILSYILTFGNIPDTSVGGLIKLGGWYLIHGWFSESADRLKILNVIGSFGKSAKVQRAAAIEAFYDGAKNNLRTLIKNKEANTTAKVADLFQCLPDAAPILARDMAANLDVVYPANQLSSENYIAIMKQLIDRDANLENYCLPF